MGWRHPNVGHHQLGFDVADQRKQLSTVGGLPHHVETRTVKQAGQTLAKQHVVVGQDHPHRSHRRADTFNRGAALLSASIPADVGGDGHAELGSRGSLDADLTHTKLRGIFRCRCGRAPTGRH